MNVDAVDRGQEIVADIRSLPFPDEHADEVMAIHVIEHFYLWEVEALMTEWVRVLRKGGFMILEAPNLLKACQYVLEGKDPSLTMWPLYGDPGHRDPLMCHRWGWTPDTLSMLMSKMGLHSVTRHTAKFKRPERDFRCVGIK